jgi:hypothetical protein
MMKLFEKRAGKKTRGQTMVEFALILPVLLMTMYGVMEFGRLLFIYITTTSAAREATRYASAVEEIGGTERYRDCTGIREAARRVDVLNAIQSIAITYYTDYGGPTQVVRGTCPVGGLGPALNLGDQVVVEVIGNFQPIVPIVPININQIEAESARTVIKDVPVGILVPPIAPTGTPSVTPPWTFFGGIYDFVSEDDPTYHHPNFFSIPVIITTGDGSTPYTDETVYVPYRLGGEASINNDYRLLSPNPLPISGGFGTIDIEIIDDTHYEYYERVIVYLDRPSIGDVVWPSTFVLYIIDDDRIPPVVEFDTPSSSVSENGSPGFSIWLKMDKVSQRDTYVPVNIISGTEPNDATLGFDFLPQTSIVRIPANVYPTYPFIVDIFDDSIVEDPERVIFELGIPLNATLGGQTTHELTILDDDLIGFSCSNYSIGTWAVSGRTMTINLRNNDPNSAPVYIKGLTAHWTGHPTSQTWLLSQIDFGGTEIWSDSVGIISPYVSDWTSLSRDRQLLPGNKDLVFTTSRSSPTPQSISVTLDNNCVLTR